MGIAFQIAFGVGLAVVALSFAGVLLGRVSQRLLVALTAALAAGATAAAAALGVNLFERFTDHGPLVLAAGGLAAAAVAEAGLIAFTRGLRRLGAFEAAADDVQARLAAFLDAEAEARAADLERTLARERANASHVLGEQERRLTVERRDLIVRQTDQARAELTDAVSRVQERLERRLSSWAADLDRGQRALETRLNELAQRQLDAVQAYEARLAADADYLKTASEEQQASLARLREELQRAGAEILNEGRTELEAHAAERRRALQEMANRLRERERDLREQMDRDTVEAQARIAAGFADAERRQLDTLERALDRAGTRLAEEAERRFDTQIKHSREKSAERLSHELDKAIEQFARRAEQEIAGRITEVAQQTADRLQRRIQDITRAAEVQHEVSAERLRAVSERLDAAFEAAEARISSFEAHIELEVTTKLDELERTIRTGE